MAGRHESSDAGRNRKPPADRMADLIDRIEEDFERIEFANTREAEKRVAEFYLHSAKAARRVGSKAGRRIDFEMDGKVGQRRRAALAEHVLEIQERSKELHPRLNVAEEYMNMDAAPFGTFSNLEMRKGFMVGAAIWIIDELQRTHRLPEAGLCLTHDADEFMETDLPVMHVPRIPDELLHSMLYAIWHRNDEPSGKKRRQETDQFDILTEAAALRIAPVEYTRPETRRDQEIEEIAPLYEGLTNRKKFDAVISMISKARIERAVDRYRAAIRDFDDFFMDCSEIWYIKCRKMANDLKKALRKFEGSRRETVFQSPATGSPLMRLPATPAWHTASMAGNLFGDDLSGQMDMISRQIEQYTDQIRLWDQAVMNSSMAFDTHWNKTKAEIFGAEVAALLGNVEIKNPYEICFAFLYLLDSGDDLPWLHGASYAVLSKAASMLPWGQMVNAYQGQWEEDEEDDFGTETEASETEQTVTYEEELKKYEYYLENPPDRIEKETEMYRQKYRRLDSDWREKNTGKEPENSNLAQYIFEATRVVMPRDASFAGWGKEDFAENGFTDDEAGIMLYLTSLAEESYRRAYNWSDLLYTSFEDDEDEGPEEAPEQDSAEEETEALKKQNRTLKAEIDRLRAQVHELMQEKKEIGKEADRAREESELEHLELVDLRELVFMLEHGEPEPELPTSDISFPYSPEKRMVVFGGHDTWLKAIRPMLPDVRFVDREMVPNAGLIRNADLVWIQPNAISHSNYYKIMDVARQHKVQVRYFTNASAEKCARQLAAADSGTLLRKP